MKIPRDVNADDLARALRELGYECVRQSGSHMRLMSERNGKHYVTVPKHKSLKPGTLLGGVLKPVAVHHGMTVEELLKKLDL